MLSGPIPDDGIIVGPPLIPECPESNICACGVCILNNYVLVDCTYSRIHLI